MVCASAKALVELHNEKSPALQKVKTDFSVRIYCKQDLTQEISGVGNLGETKIS